LNTFKIIIKTFQPYHISNWSSTLLYIYIYIYIYIFNDCKRLLSTLNFLLLIMLLDYFHSNIYSLKGGKWFTWYQILKEKNTQPKNHLSFHFTPIPAPDIFFTPIFHEIRRSPSWKYFLVLNVYPIWVNWMNIFPFILLKNQW